MAASARVAEETRQLTGSLEVVWSRSSAEDEAAMISATNPNPSQNVRFRFLLKEGASES